MPKLKLEYANLERDSNYSFGLLVFIFINIYVIGREHVIEGQKMN